MEDRLLVFVSSAIGELKHEREVVEKAIAAIRLTRPWVFEHTPASADPLAQSYLRKAKECDLFLLLLGNHISDAVKEEYQTAVDHKKRRLVFLKNVERTPEAAAFVQHIDVKSADFESDIELHQAVQHALVDELIKGYRAFNLQPDDLSHLGRMATLLVQGHSAIGEAIVQTGDIRAENSAVALGPGAIATLNKHFADFRQPLEAILTDCLIVVIVGELFFFFAIEWNPQEIGWTICFILPVMICAPSYAVPVAVFGLALSIPMRNRRNIALSIVVGALGIALAVLGRIVIELGGRIYGG